MTDQQVQAAYQQLLATPPDNLEEGAFFELAQAPPQAKAEAQAWLQLSRALYEESVGLGAGADLGRVQAQRQQALAVVYLLAKGAEPRQLPALPAPSTPSAPPAATLAQNLVEVIKRSQSFLSAELWAQVQALLTPTSIAVMTGVFAAWAVGHAVGVGVVADLVLAALGAAFLGWNAIRAARLLYGVINQAMPPAKDEALTAAAKDFAELVVLVGVDVVTAIFLGKAFKKARSRLERSPGRVGPERAPEERGAPERGTEEQRRRSAPEERGTVEERRSAPEERGTVVDVLRGGGAAGLPRARVPWGLVALGGGAFAVLLIYVSGRKS